MKKLVLLLMTAMLVATPRAYAQEENDSMLFNHLSIGVDWGLLGRMGLDVAAPITPMLDVRAGFNTAAITALATQLGVESAMARKSVNGLTVKDGVYTLTLSEPIQSHGADISKMTFEPVLKTSYLDLLVDFFPIKKARFHITAGAFFSLGGSTLLHTEVSALNADGQPGVPKSDWANTTIYGISTDKDGKIQLDIKYGLPVKPYVGIGWGRPVDTDRRVGFNFDMGVYFIGGVHAYSYDYSSGNAKAVELNSAWINQNEDIKEYAGQYTKYLDTANGFPLLPMIRFSLFVRLF